MRITDHSMAEYLMNYLRQQDSCVHSIPTRTTIDSQLLLRYELGAAIEIIISQKIFILMLTATVLVVQG